ncbi:uncharacterized protein LOC128336435 isoform X2 [Hemicordylus capensis]|uniref:uncharacterized protein LOC128336435 isoform X2 n=1 Tax=Hemicordylus capensis TaxID=884348 RepID=UPI002302C1BF|nr:uncharacterized protein LOC128336435 isoform X2 [Hemicordylus capensis]
MAPGPGGDRPMSARGLARSVAHRLKYYVDVKRKEESFDSSGVLGDETESSSLSIKEKQQLEHDFAKIKLEASLRAYVGNAKECNRKVQKSLEKQKDLEKLIRKMAQDYVPVRTNEGKVKHKKRRKKQVSTHLPGLHTIATPCLSPEEVRRLISSASKLIVAATSEISPEELGTQERASSPARIAAQAIQCSNHPGQNIHSSSSSQQRLSSTNSHMDEAKSIQEYNEESSAEVHQKHSEKNSRKKLNKSRKEQHSKDIKRPTEISSDTSRNSHKPKEAFSKTFLKSCDIHSLNSIAPYPHTGQNEVCRKGILKKSSSFSCTSSAVSQNQETKPNMKGKNISASQKNAENSAGLSCKPAGIKAEKSSPRSVRMVSRSRPSTFLSTRASLSSRNIPGANGYNIDGHSAKSRAEVIHTHRSTAREKNGRHHTSEYTILKGQDRKVCNPVDQKRTLVENSQKLEQEMCDSVIKGLPESHRVRFQKLQHGYNPGTTEWKPNSLGCWSLDNLRGPFSGPPSPIAAEGKCPELMPCLQEGQHIPVIVCGSSFLYHVCQGMDQDTPTSLVMNVDSSLENQNAHHLLNPLLSLTESGDGDAVEDPGSSLPILDTLTAEPWEQPMVCSSPAPPGGYRCPAPASYQGRETSKEHGSGPPHVTTTVSESLESEESDFAISSPSSSWSAWSLASIQKQMEEENTNSRMDVLVKEVLNVMQKNSISQEGREIGEHREKRRSSAEEDKAEKGNESGGVCAKQVVYFAQLSI